MAKKIKSPLAPEHLVVGDVQTPDLAVRYVWGDLDPHRYPHIHSEWTSSRKDLASLDFVFTLNVQVLSGGKFSSRTTTTDRGSTAATIQHALRHLASQLAPRLYENDPRIGLSITLGGAFPVCPLFDRPDHNVAVNAQKFCDKEPFTWELCPFCRFTNDSTAVWCGGNVGFAHEICAPWVPHHTLNNP